MDISREQFFSALESSASNPVHYRITQQILSVDDFVSFRRMMIKKNVQINEIAMNELMQKDVGDDQDADQQPGGGDAGGDDMDEQMRMAMEMSKVQQQDAD